MSGRCQVSGWPFRIPHMGDSLPVTGLGEDLKRWLQEVDGSRQKGRKYGCGKAREEKPECEIENKEGFSLH